MEKLSMSNFKKNLGEPQPVEPIVPVEPTPVEPTTIEPTEPASQEPVQPTVIDSEPTPVEPVQNINPDGSGEPTPSPTNVEPSVEPSVIETKPLELTDELVGNYLSEKLGKQFDLEDLGKEVVNPLDSDPYLKEIYEWRNKTGRPVEDFFKFQKDYSQVSDIDIVRENLQLDYPDATAQEINLELSRLTPSEDDLEDDVARKNWELKKLATKGRAELDKLKSNLSEPTTTHLPEEIQNKVSFANTIEKQIEDNNKFQVEYDQAITQTALSTESINLNLGDSEISYNISEDKRKSLPQDISDMSHWKNPDGSYNHKAVVEDGVKIKYFDEMIKLAYEQGLNSGKDSIIKETRNITLDGANTVPQQNTPSRGYTVEEPNGGTTGKLTMKSYKR